MNRITNQLAITILKTKRLTLREFELSDAKSLYELNSDPEVIKYTGDPPFKNIEEAKEFILNYNHYKKYGFGRWAVILNSTNEFIGWCGIKYTKEKDEHDIGFRFFRKYWGHGYASESAAACVDYAYNTLNIKKLYGRAMKENIASIRVLEKIGMKYSHDFKFDNTDGVVYIKKKHLIK